MCLLLHPAVDVDSGRLKAGLEVHRLQLCVVVLPGLSQEILEPSATPLLILILTTQTQWNSKPLPPGESFRNHCFTSLCAGLLPQPSVIIPFYVKLEYSYGSLSFIPASHSLNKPTPNHEEAQSHTHLNKLVGLLPVQSVGNAEGVGSICLVELPQQLAEAGVDIILTVLGFQTLWTKQTSGVRDPH